MPVKNNHNNFEDSFPFLLKEIIIKKYAMIIYELQFKIMHIYWKNLFNIDKRIQSKAKEKNSKIENFILNFCISNIIQLNLTKIHFCKYTSVCQEYTLRI